MEPAAVWFCQALPIPMLVFVEGKLFLYQRYATGARSVEQGACRDYPGLMDFLHWKKGLLFVEVVRIS